MEVSSASKGSYRLTRWLRVFRIVGFVFLAGLWLYPWSLRLRTPNIVLDDVPRLVDLQTLPLRVLLFRPFNEHLAPWFELVSSVTWELTGRTLARAPLAFSLASYVPFVGCLPLLWAVARRELRSRTAAWITVVLFVTNPAYADCVYWYSASSFTWALGFTLAGLWYAGKARDASSTWSRPLWAAAAFCAVAPMASAIGLLTGPLVAVLIGVDGPGQRRLRLEPRCLPPLVGTGLYLAMASMFRYQDVVSHSLHESGEIGPALVQAAAAPAYLAMRGYLGIFEPRTLLPTAALGLVSLGVFVLVLVRYVRGEEEERRGIRVGVAMIVGGYGLIYGVRARSLGVEVLLATQRYHLFPCVGVALLLSAVLARWLRQFDGRPVAELGLATGFTVILMLVNARVGLELRQYFRLQTDQRPALRALDQLAAAAADLGLTRTQVIACFDPIEPRWSFPDVNILKLLPESADRPRGGATPDENRARLLGRLTSQDRAAFLSCVDLTQHLLASAEVSRGADDGGLEPVRVLRLDPLTRPGHYASRGWPAFLEFVLRPEAQRPPWGLQLTGLSRPTTWELWWTTETEGWSPDRTLVIRLSTRPMVADGWVVPLRQVPGLDPRRLQRIRMMARDPGPVSLEEVRLIR